ncbi:MAG: deoxynucleoside kinase [Acidobacteria bacterium]|nr:MAG: deoxynucleoside kinase [Acidobacteriota bacterium]
MQWNYIAFEGPIGVGKTSLVTLLSERLEAVRLLEDVSNPFLESFYDEVPGAAFQAQLFFLLSRYRQLTEAAQGELFQQLTLADHTFQKDRIFAHLTLTDSELMLYERLWSLLAPQLPKPDMVVYLQGSTDVLMQRVQRRKRAEETGISRAYLDEVNQAYAHYFYHYQETPLLVINTSEIDFVAVEADLDDLIAQIDSMETGTRVYVPRHDR